MFAFRIIRLWIWHVDFSRNGPTMCYKKTFKKQTNKKTTKNKQTTKSLTRKAVSAGKGQIFEIVKMVFRRNHEDIAYSFDFMPLSSTGTFRKPWFPFLENEATRLDSL